MLSLDVSVERRVRKVALAAATDMDSPLDIILGAPLSPLALSFFLVGTLGVRISEEIACPRRRILPPFKVSILIISLILLVSILGFCLLV